MRYVLSTAACALALGLSGSRLMVGLETDQIDGGVPNPCNAVSTRHIIYDCDGPAGCDVNKFDWYWVVTGDWMDIKVVENNPCPDPCFIIAGLKSWAVVPPDPELGICKVNQKK
jgi:hypothetical protein